MSSDSENPLSLPVTVVIDLSTLCMYTNVYLPSPSYHARVLEASARYFFSLLGHTDLNWILTECSVFQPIYVLL